MGFSFINTFALLSLSHIIIIINFTIIIFA